MSESTLAQFPEQELEKSVGRIKGLLETSKHLAVSAAPNSKIGEAIAKYIEVVQVLLAEAGSWPPGGFEDGKMNKLQELQRQQRIKQLQLKRRNGTITRQELEELNRLEGRSGGQ